LFPQVSLSHLPPSLPPTVPLSLRPSLFPTTPARPCFARVLFVYREGGSLYTCPSSNFTP
jgi:hypothetical protein